jgi:hypothetical protein
MEELEPPGLSPHCSSSPRCFRLWFSAKCRNRCEEGELAGVRDIHNVTDISFGYWFIGFNVSSDVSNMVGACASDSSGAIPSTGATADGQTLSYECFGAGVSCSTGTANARIVYAPIWRPTSATAAGVA